MSWNLEEILRDSGKSDKSFIFFQLAAGFCLIKFHLLQ